MVLEASAQRQRAGEYHWDGAGVCRAGQMYTEDIVDCERILGASRSIRSVSSPRRRHLRTTSAKLLPDEACGSLNCARCCTDTR